MKKYHPARGLRLEKPLVDVLEKLVIFSILFMSLHVHYQFFNGLKFQW